MKKFNLTSERFTGHLVLGFGSDGALVYYHNESQMTLEQLNWCSRNLPPWEASLETFANQVKAKPEEIPQDLSFDNFWEAYGKKINKKRSEPLFNKLADVDKSKAIMAIPAYKGYLNRTGFRGQADPEKYLRERYFETNWNREK